MYLTFPDSAEEEAYILVLLACHRKTSGSSDLVLHVVPCEISSETRRGQGQPPKS